MKSRIMTCVFEFDQVWKKVHYETAELVYEIRKAMYRNENGDCGFFSWLYLLYYELFRLE